MKNKLWIFGDSVSAGTGQDKNHEYYKKFLEPYNIEKKEHGVYLSEKLNLELKQLSIGGLSNDAILRKVIENLSNFKKGDRIIIGITDHFRFEMLLPHHEKSEYKSFLVHEFYQDIDNPNLMNNLHPNTDINNSIRNYTRYIHLESLSYTNVSISKQLRSIMDHLNSIGIDTFIWNYHRRSLVGTYIDVAKIEDISKSTNNEVIDHHPSYKGHEELADIIFNKLTNRTPFER